MSILNSGQREKLSTLIAVYEAEITSLLAQYDITHAQIDLNYNVHSTGAKASTKLHLSRSKEDRFYVEEKKILNDEHKVVGRVVT